MNRCKWCNINNPKYIDYHDNEWGKLKTDDNYLFGITYYSHHPRAINIFR